MKTMKIGLAALAALVMGTVSAMAVELKLAHAAPASDLQQNLSVYFAEKVAERTKGAVTVKIFPQGQLGNDQQMITGARSGVIDVVMVGLNNFTGMMPRAGAIELPFVFRDQNQAYKALDGDVGKSLLADFEKFGLKGLAFPENGWRNMTNNTRPIKLPADAAGIRMRTNNSVPLNELFALLKANPQQLPVGELYSALETGVVNAQDHPINIVVSFKFYEVQKYLSLTQHAYSALGLAMNLDRFKALTPEQQKIVMDAAAEATAMQRKLSGDKQEEFLAELAKHGMKINRDVDKAAFQEVAAPTWANFVKANGDDLIKAIQAVR